MKLDKELEQYRTLMTVPDRFDDGFSFSSFLGVLFVALVMVPGALYMELLAGQGVGPAAQWVTVILFIEIAKRANAKLKRAQIFVLFYMCGALTALHASNSLLWTQFVVRSEAAVSFGLASMFPDWVAPSDPSAYDDRSFFQWVWLPAVGMIAFKSLFSRLDSAVMAYGLFRIASDVERLPFPLAPVGASGMMALADDLEGKDKDKGSWRWRIFAIGGAMGMVFGLLYMGLPTLTGNILGRTMSFLPIPFADWSTYTQDWLPATATGLSFNLGALIVGMVMPFWAIIGSFLGLVCSMLANPILYYAGILQSWKEGDRTVEILFKNSVDLYFSLGIGLALAIAVVGIWGMLRTRKGAAESALSSGPPKGRGDIPNKLIIGIYITSVSTYTMLSWWLCHWHMGVLCVLVFFGFIYTPIISYVTARLEGIAGQVIEIPFIRELSLIVSGYKGIEVWFVPIPKANYGVQTVFYRQAELTGTRFTSIWKADLYLYPVIILSMLTFSSFIWGLAEIPSGTYPFAQQMWELNAKNECLMWSSTSGEYSKFQDALSGTKVAIGFGIGMTLLTCLSWLGAPITLAYGFVRGMGGTLPHTITLEFIGAMIGKWYFERRLGLTWRQYVPVLSAGFFCGGGLVTMFCIGIVFMFKSTGRLPF